LEEVNMIRVGVLAFAGALSFFGLWLIVVFIQQIIETRELSVYVGIKGKRR